MSNKDVIFKAKESYEKYIIRKPGNECWGWSGSITQRGYASFQVSKQVFAAHRFAWEITFGPIPKGLVCCHHCDNPSCSRIEHLFLATPQQNMKDRDRKGRTSKGSKHHNSNFTEKEVSYIKFLLKNGIRPIELSKKYEVTDVCISCIKFQKSWKHVEMDNSRAFDPFEHLELIMPEHLLEMLSTGSYDYINLKKLHDENLDK